MNDLETIQIPVTQEELRLLKHRYEANGVSWEVWLRMQIKLPPVPDDDWARRRIDKYFSDWTRCVIDHSGEDSVE